jgi:hypothetical protein
MRNEERDPDLNWMRAEWQSIEMPMAARRDTMHAYRRSFGLVRSRRFWAPLVAATLAASAALVLIRAHPPEPQYRPVAQPHIIDISQGERP